MKIKKFKQIDARIYRKFSWPDDSNNLPEFSDYNLIYGWNGTGKTTLADILQIVERSKVDEEGGFRGFSIECDSPPAGYDTRIITLEAVRGKTSPEKPPIRVFNRDYVDSNVFATNGAIPIFFIGEENIAKQKELEEKLASQETLLSEVQEKKKTKEQKKEDFDTFCANKAKEIRLIVGSENTQSYNQSRFKKNCEYLISSGDPAQQAKTEEEQETLRKTINSIPRSEITPLSFSFPDLTILAEEVQGLLEKTVFSRTIAALMEDHATSTWVRTGLQLHKGHKSENCKFCDQAIPAARLTALEGHFNDAFQKLDSALDTKIKQVDQASSDLKALRLPSRNEFYDDLGDRYDAACLKLNEQKNDCAEFLGQLKAALESKKTILFRAVKFDSVSSPDYGTTQLNDVNAIITAHNDRTKNFKKEIGAAKEAMKSALVAAAIGEYQRLQSGLKEAEDAEKGLHEQYKSGGEEIGELRKSACNSVRAAKDLNKDLKDYLGRSEIRFELKEDKGGYSIMRGGKSARNLSEGEKTAIALLYFLKTLEDNDFTLSKGIVVIDDPVDSMDDNAMFSAFGYIRAKTEKAKQLFILTHHFAFFSQVKRWFKLSKGRAQFYQTVCFAEEGQRISKLQKLDALLCEYNSEYHYLFSLTYRASEAADSSGSLEAYYHMPNVVRRVLEIFLAFRIPDLLGKPLWSIMDESRFDQAKKEGILRFLHTHSHGDRLDSHEHDPSILSETPQIMKWVLELIRHEDKKHYDRMLEAVKSAMKCQ